MQLGRFLVVAVVVAVTCGCVSSNERLKACYARNHALEGQLATANQEIASLKITRKQLQDKLAFEHTRANTAIYERNYQATEKESIKRIVQTAIHDQFQALAALQEQEGLFNIVGNELLPRKRVTGKNLCLVDRSSAIPAAGMLIGSRGYFSGPCKFRVQILRPVEKTHFVVWKSDVLTADTAGLHKYMFRTPVRVNKGDLVAYTFEGPVNVPYDEGTGSTGWLNAASARNTQVNIGLLADEDERRAYSLCVVGTLGL
jgi:hypothetical protein